MADDPRSYIQQNLDRAEVEEGRKLSPQEFGEWFVRHDRMSRSESIHTMNRDDAIRGNDELTLEEAGRYLEEELPYEKMLRHMHTIANKVGK